MKWIQIKYNEDISNYIALSHKRFIIASFYFNILIANDRSCVNILKKKKKTKRKLQVTIKKNYIAR